MLTAETGHDFLSVYETIAPMKPSGARRVEAAPRQLASVCRGAGGAQQARVQIHAVDDEV